MSDSLTREKTSSSRFVLEVMDCPVLGCGSSMCAMANEWSGVPLTERQNLDLGPVIHPVKTSLTLWVLVFSWLLYERCETLVRTHWITWDTTVLPALVGVQDLVHFTLMFYPEIDVLYRNWRFTWSWCFFNIEWCSVLCKFHELWYIWDM